MSESADVRAHRARRRIEIRAPQDFAAGIALVAVALLAFSLSADLGEGRFYSVGPGLLPRMVATLLGVIGVALTVASLTKEGDALGRWPLRGPLFVFMAVAAFAFSIRTVGLALAGPLVALISGAASPETKPRELILFALVVTALSIALFRYLLHLPIPILVIPRVLVL
jgi:putative tricarboxylic transport membrane protein